MALSGFFLNSFSLLAADQLHWGAPQWALPAGVIVIASAALIVWSYGRSDINAAVRWAAAALKLLAIGLLAICLLQPMWRGSRPRPQANILPIIVDNSKSMRLKTSKVEQSRAQKAGALLDEQSEWRVRLAQSFDVRQYAFDSRLQSVDDLASLQSDGDVSSMAGSLQSLAERFRGRPVAGAILFTDGNLTDMPDSEVDWSKLSFPVYPVLPKSDGEIRDLRIADVSVRQTDFESAPMTVTVVLEGIGIANEQVNVQLRDLASDKVVEEKSVRLDEAGERREASFRFRPEKTGVSFYSAAVFTEAERELIGKDPQEADLSTAEATFVNNTWIVTVDRATGPYRILYVAGRPNWEFKFLRRALQEDAEVQLVSLLRIANKEPKFSFRDKGVNDSNPLFAGLGESEEEAAQQYDEPVILRLGVKESDELSDGFPETAEELFAYHGVILDDLEGDFFTQDQLLLLRRFISARGGGLLFLGGQESFAGRRFSESPLGELAPIYVPRSSAAKDSGPYRFSLTREGLLQPWVRLRDNEAAELERLNEMPLFLTLNAVGDLKPGASKLATVESETGKKVPALVAQRFGKGRTAALVIGDMWRWSMRREQGTPDDSAQAWRQLSHWLVNDVPRRAEVRVETSDDPGQPATIVATARDEAYLPLDNATVELTVTPQSGEASKLRATMDGNEPGVYRATFWSPGRDGYQVRADITSADGSHVGSATSGWTSQPNAAEFRDLRLNRSLLEKIASQTGGQVVQENRLKEFAVDLPTRDVPVEEQWSYPIWHRPWVMMLAMLCLCCEWGLRRWKGLA